MAAPAKPPVLQNRIASLDQFRGYTVAGMFLVNYLGYYLAAPFVLRHHNTYCSYADTIMPQFFFAVGFSFRLSFGRRTIQQGLTGAYWHVVKRLLGLALVAIVITYHAHPPLGKDDFNWHAITHLGVWRAIWPGAIKNTWFQTLMHIAVTSLWILPVIRLRPSWRVLYMIASAGIHFWLSSWFNFEWVNGIGDFKPSGIDGGPLGFLSWTIPTMVGTLACDAVMHPRSSLGVMVRLFGWGALLMALGWVASCLTRCYDVPTAVNKADKRFAASPVLVAKEDFDKWTANIKEKNWSKVLAESPLVPPPGSEVPKGAVESPKGTVPTMESPNYRSRAYWTTRARERPEDKSSDYRKWNYWMMSQRAGSLSYLTFGAGLSLVIYGLFYILADVVGLRVGVFRTFGSNALLGYVLQDPIEEAVKNFTPHDVPPFVMWISVAIYFFLIWLIIRSLEKRKIYIKL